MEKEILGLIGSDMVSYIEVEYFAGEGRQSGIIWMEGKRIFEMEFEQGVVNRVLQHFGVMKGKSKRDEFDTVGLGRHRNTKDWIKETE